MSLRDVGPNCPHGHPRVEFEVIRRDTQSRECRKCANIRTLANYYKRKARNKTTPAGDTPTGVAPESHG